MCKYLKALGAALLAALVFCLAACSEEAQKAEWHKAQFQDISVSYLESGKKDAAALVFIHGWSCDTSFWRMQIPEFSNNYHVISIDLPGFGRSDKPQDRAYSMGFFAAAVEAVLKDAKVDNPVLIGHSMGYAVSRQFLIDYPGTVRAVVNVDGAYFNIPERLEDIEAFEAMTGAMLAMHEGPERPEAVREFVESTFYGKTAPELQKEIMSAMASADAYAATSALREMCRLGQWEERSFDVPSLAVYATSEHLPPEHGAYLRTVFSRLVYLEWDDLGHYIMLEAPERFNAELAKYLQALP